MRHLLSYSAGLHRLRGVIDDVHLMLDWNHITAGSRAEAPRWEPGTRFGYHGITYGFLVGEVIRRVTGGRCTTWCRPRSSSRSTSTAC